MSALCPAKMYITEIGNSHVSTNSVCPPKAQSQIEHIVGFFLGGGIGGSHLALLRSPPDSLLRDLTCGSQGTIWNARAIPLY